jgi:CheY-like chemotaxis protein
MLFLILSVGRNPHLLRERNSSLTAAGYSVVPAYSKDEAMEKLLDGDFDLILICSSLGTDGCQLAKMVRHIRPSIPTVSISANDDSIQTCNANLAGYRAAEFVQAVDQILVNEYNKFAAKHVLASRSEKLTHS